ncbi:Ig-like domain-containing protein, partial [Pantoea dispersa]|uniref:Ig-like domain-containing protein n=1 Tax=Pantoea dispersa TaxID=59814 RepID=UPI003016EEFF
TNDARPLLSGRAEAGSLVTIYDGGVAIASVTADEAGDWAWQYPAGQRFGEGEHTLTVRAVDAAGNLSAGSDPFVITVDTVIAQPIISTVIDAVSGGVNGPLPADDVGLTNDSRPAMSGRAEAGSLVTIYDGGVAIASVTADEAGDWAWQYPAGQNFSEGKHTLTVIAVDAAGNQSGVSNTFVLTVDTILPSASPIVASSVDVTKIWSGSTTNDKRPQISGTGEAGTLMHIYQNGNVVGSLKVSQSGNWTWQPEKDLADGSYDFQVTYQDNAGNTARTAPISVNVDTVVPDAASNIEWDGQNLRVEFDGSSYQVGDRIVMNIDGQEHNYILKQSDLDANEIVLDWPSSEHGNFDVLDVKIIDSVGNTSNGLKLNKDFGISHTENFEKQPAGAFTANQVFNFSGFDLKVINPGNGGGFFKGRAGWDLPSPTMALTLSAGTKIEIELPDGNSDYISFDAGDFNNIEQFTVIFYDKNGSEVDRQILTPSGGLSQKITATVPYGMTFSKVSLELNVSGVWIDNIEIGKTSYHSSVDETLSYTGLNNIDITLNETTQIFPEINTTEAALKIEKDDLGLKLKNLTLNANDIIVDNDDNIFTNENLEQLTNEDCNEGEIKLSNLLGENSNIDSWDSHEYYTSGQECFDIMKPLDKYIDPIAQQEASTQFE